MGGASRGRRIRRIKVTRSGRKTFASLCASEHRPRAKFSFFLPVHPRKEPKWGFSPALPVAFQQLLRLELRGVTVFHATTHLSKHTTIYLLALRSLLLLFFHAQRREPVCTGPGSLKKTELKIGSARGGGERRAHSPPCLPVFHSNPFFFSFL